MSAEDDRRRPRFPKRVTLKWEAPPLRLPGEGLPRECLSDEGLPGEAPLPYRSDEGTSDQTAELELPEARPPDRPSAPPPGFERGEGVDGWERQGPRLTPPPFRPLTVEVPLLEMEQGGALDLVDRRSRPATPTPELAVEMSDRYALGDYSAALPIAELILGRDPHDATAERVATSCRARLGQLYRSRLGSLTRVPRVAVDASEMRWLGLDHRAAFLLSRVDGQQTMADLVDVSGMPALEALKILVELLDVGAIDLS